MCAVACVLLHVCLCMCDVACVRLHACCCMCVVACVPLRVYHDDGRRGPDIDGPMAAGPPGQSPHGGDRTTVLRCDCMCAVRELIGTVGRGSIWERGGSIWEWAVSLRSPYVVLYAPYAPNASAYAPYAPYAVF